MAEIVEVFAYQRFSNKSELKGGKELMLHIVIEWGEKQKFEAIPGRLSAPPRLSPVEML